MTGSESSSGMEGWLWQNPSCKKSHQGKVIFRNSGVASSLGMVAAAGAVLSCSLPCSETVFEDTTYSKDLCLIKPVHAFNYVWIFKRTKWLSTCQCKQ